MPRQLKIDFVSDIVCPWCVVGLGGLEEALGRLEGEIAADIRVQPFELNPAMPPEGENRIEHLMHKYGSTPDQVRANQETIRARAASVGFEMRMRDEGRIYNTFDAHRLLHWAEGSERQIALKKALFDAYFHEGLDIGNADVLAGKVEAAGLDPQEARAVLASDRFAAEVRRDEQLWQSRGINSVPAVIVEDRYLISGGQPAAAFEDALRRIAAELGSAA